MLRIQETVKQILLSDEEALSALFRGYMNLSAYAKKIRAEVEARTKKEVEKSGIVVALSRLKKEVKKSHPLTQEVRLKNITTHAPLSELVFPKERAILARLSSLYEKVQTTNDDFFTTTLSTNEITLICSDRIKGEVLKHLKDKPSMVETGLASLGLSLDPKYYYQPNITFSLLRKIAEKRIVLAETITTHTEIIFVFKQKNLAEVLNLFEIEA